MICKNCGHRLLGHDWRHYPKGTKKPEVFHMGTVKGALRIKGCYCGCIEPYPILSEVDKR